MREPVRTPVYRVDMSSPGGYPHYPHTRKPNTGKIVLIVLAVAIGFVCCCGAGLFIAFRPDAAAEVTHSIVRTFGGE
jgi:hypothetical protein